MSNGNGTEPHEGLTHLKTYDVKDSNVELIGSDIDHKVKYKSAETEPAWKGLGSSSGLWVWRIEKFHVVPWPKEKYGTFHEGDSYIVLYSVKAGSNSNDLKHDVYFWLGKDTTQDEAGAAAYKTVELDEFLHGKASQHREVQGNESGAFLSLFPRITLLHGGIETGFKHVEQSKPTETLLLYRITKAIPRASSGSSLTPSKRTNTLVQQVQPSWTSLVDDDCFILDRGTKIFIWQGKKCSPIEKAKAAQVAHDMTLSRQAQTEVVAQTDSRAYTVLQVLGGSIDSPIPSSSTRLEDRDSQRAPGNAAVRQQARSLFRISDASGTLQFEAVKGGSEGSNMSFSRNDLDTNDVFLLDDAGRQLWIWQGQSASRGERAAWLHVAQHYLRSLVAAEKMPTSLALSTPISKIVEGNESSAFQSALAAGA